MQYLFDNSIRQIHASVRELCEFLFRTGNVYSGGTDITGNAMVRGAKIHRDLQNRYKKENPEYCSEFHIKYTEDFDGYEYHLTGSMDGILEKGDATVIDEFKTTALELENLEWNSIKSYSAQLMCYGFMYAQVNSLNFITLRLTYYNYDDDDTKTIEKEFTYTELRKWFDEFIGMHLRWARLVYNHKIRRNESLHQMTFPYGEFRKGQRELSAKIYRCIRDGKRLFAEAPTGIGKTVSTLFPSLKALGEGEGDKIFYLSAKNVGAIAATDCLDVCRKKGAQINYTSMTSKEKLCRSERNCLPSECEYSKGHYDRVNDALYELISENDTITKEILLDISEKHMVCPFELQLDASEYCDVVVGDYNYVFDPKAKLCRYFGEGTGDYITLVDEAHNLVDRAREMYSASLTLIQLKKYSKQFKGLRKLTGRLNKCIAFMEKVRSGLELSEKNEKKISLSENDLQPFRDFCDAYRKFLSEDETHDEVKKQTLQLFFDISFFVEIFDIESVFQDDYIDFCTLTENDTCVKLYCANPSNQISLATAKMRSCTFFSATMTPSEYYIRMLGADLEEDEILSLPSPFPSENFLTCVYKNVSTRFKDRQQSIEKVCNIIKIVTEKKTGNYLCFFPSYAYMQSVYDEFCVMFPEENTVLQNKEMSSEERSDFLECFKENPDKTLIGFALSGGMFSEGVDLKGDRLSGAVIVGTGLPGICFERDMLKEHFDKTIGDGLGYNYAYTYTGLNRVYQAAGRVIRTKTDKGFAVLVDDRYAKMSHRRTFPQSWKNVRLVNDEQSLSRVVDEFWNE